MKRLLIILLLLPLFAVPAHADDLYDRAGESLGAGAIMEVIPESAREISGELTVDGSYDTQKALDKLWQTVTKNIQNYAKAEISTASALIGISFLCAACGALCTEKSSEQFVSAAGCCAVVYLTVSGNESVLNAAETALTQLSDYSKAALPVIYTAAAASGSTLSAPGRYAAVCLALDVMMSTAQTVLIPMICTFLALSIAGSVFSEPFVRAAASFVKKCVVSVMTAMTILFCGYIGIVGLVSGSMDAVAVRTTKTILSTSLPIVGGILSDAASTVLSAASVVRNSAGVFSLIVVCALCVGPLILLTVKMMIFKLTSVIAETAPNGRMTALLNDIGTALGMLTGLVGCCAVMLFLSIVSGIRAVSI